MRFLMLKNPHKNVHVSQTSEKKENSGKISYETVHQVVIKFCYTFERKKKGGKKEYSRYFH